MNIGWALNVNKHIIDSTTLDLGEGVIENETETGKVDTYLKSSCVPEVINVTMDFDFFEKDEDGLTEFDRFCRWFKYEHKYGSVPFEFPTIYRTGEDALKKLSIYRIKKSPSFSKRGYQQRATMTWVEVFKEVISIPQKPVLIQGGYAENGRLHIELKEPLNKTPATGMFDITVYKDDNPVSCTITDVTSDGASLDFYFNELSQGRYIIYVSDDENFNEFNLEVL